MPNMGTTINTFEDMGLRDEVGIMVGGAPVTQDFADEMGADAYGENAVDAVDKAKELIDLYLNLSHKIYEKIKNSFKSRLEKAKSSLDKIYQILKDIYLTLMK